MAKELPGGPRFQLNTEFRYLGMQQFTPDAVFELYRPDEMPKWVPTLVVHEQEESIDVVGSLRRLRSRCRWLTAIAALQMLILLVITFMRP